MKSSPYSPYDFGPYVCNNGNGQKEMNM